MRKFKTTIHAIRAKHGTLIDKKFSIGLTQKERLELRQINRMLDMIEEKYYEPAKRTLTVAIIDKIVEEMQTK